MRTYSITCDFCGKQENLRQEWYRPENSGWKNIGLYFEGSMHGSPSFDACETCLGNVEILKWSHNDKEVEKFENEKTLMLKILEKISGIVGERKSK